IIGFPRETEQEFFKTGRLGEEICFYACNTAAYSPRPPTPAAHWPDQVPEDIKYERLRLLHARVGQVSHRRNKRYLGSSVEVLVEGRSERNPERLSGRTRTNKVVNFEGPDTLVGQLANVEVQAANPWALRGVLV